MTTDPQRPPTEDGAEHPEHPDVPEEVTEDTEEPEPFADGPPPLPQPMFVLDGTLPDDPAPAAEPVQEDHGTCRCGGAFDADGWCTECGERKPEPRHHFSARAGDRVAAVCDRGVRHHDNQDAMAVWAEGGRAALVVCDGVTTATRSEEASLAAAEAAVALLAADAESSPAERLVSATDAAATAVAQVALDHPDSAPSCTFVAVVVEEGTATFGSVGDSRGYWIPDEGEAARLTADDSMAEEQVRAGVPRAAAEAGPLAHTITRWLGPDSPDHRPVVTAQDVSAPGWVLICTDGLWNYASEPADLRAVLRAEERRVGRDPHDLAQALVAWAIGRGGIDNITVALARTGADEAAVDEPRVEEPGGEGEDGSHG